MSTSPAETNAARWARSRTFHHSLYTAERVAADRRKSVSVCVPARECAGTIDEIVGVLVGLREVGAIDEIVVVDAASADGTALVAQRAGATVYQEAELLAEYGPVLGKGDAMWRALSALEGELVCFVDADTEGFSAHFVTGLLGPLVCESEVSFVKAFYRRPLGEDDDGGGRVNRLMARPALASLYPELGEVHQPLAGEVAARRELLDVLRFETGYGVEMGMLIDAWTEVGLRGIAQVDLGEHRHEHKSLPELAPMARTVLMAILARLEGDDHLGPWYDRLGLTGDIEWEVLEDLDPTPTKRPSLAAIGMARSAR
ncbi:MAG TPA: glucosyl-3-phosphoglycerate synthase [Solirubrobacteraceae bacterium]|jgi:glucosyl-3-phosphoglycerate synthase|nr:glucosyl-3-phosphoglycerate synthase [Solirubrobacteraceae bacterium]